MGKGPFQNTKIHIIPLKLKFKITRASQGQKLSVSCSLRKSRLYFSFRGFFLYLLEDKRRRGERKGKVGRRGRKERSERRFEGHEKDMRRRYDGGKEGKRREGRGKIEGKEGKIE